MSRTASGTNIPVNAKGVISSPQQRPLDTQQSMARAGASGMTKWPTATAFLALALAMSVAADAQEWPSHPIRFIVPFPAGGSTDIGARVIADGLSRALGQQIVVENKSGASGNVGFEAAVRSAADGYTVLIGP